MNRLVTTVPAKVRLHDLFISHYCVKARAILGFKGVPFERVRARYDEREDLLRVSGQDYVPYLEWGEVGVTWERIPDFLESKIPAPTLFPTDERPVQRMIESWAHLVLEEHVWRYVVSDAPKTFADSRERWVFEEMQTRSRGPLEVMAHRKPEFFAALQKDFDLIESALESRPFLTGGAPALADFAAYGALSPIWTTGNALPDDRKRLAEWRVRVEHVSRLA